MNFEFRLCQNSQKKGSVDNGVAIVHEMPAAKAGFKKKEDKTEKDNSSGNRRRQSQPKRNKQKAQDGMKDEGQEGTLKTKFVRSEFASEFGSGFKLGMACGCYFFPLFYRAPGVQMSFAAL